MSEGRRVGTEVTDALLQLLSPEPALEGVNESQREDSSDSASASPAAELGRRGGVARARKLSRERRVEIARKAAAQRWSKSSP